MICILSGNLREAERYAIAQELQPEEWFYPSDMDDLRTRKNFHVIVVGSVGENVPVSYFNKVYELAKERGRMK
jgi:hypothetical protein